MKQSTRVGLLRLTIEPPSIFQQAIFRIGIAVKRPEHWLRGILGFATVALATLLAGYLSIGLARAGPFFDPTSPGPFAVAHGDYKLPAVVDPEIDRHVATELWARLYRPVPLGGGHHPLIMILHGNHGTCGRFIAGTPGRVDDNAQYTTHGTCPGGYVVTPNHLGYAYIAERLASFGYIVVSVNSNRGINAAAGDWPDDEGLNLRRGRLMLRHLQTLAYWNRTGDNPGSLGINLRGQIDLNHVGLMGHSRGGEGVLAAFRMYRDKASPWPARIGDHVGFDAMLEVAPVDGQTSRVFSALNIPWTVLLPMCDGDVSDLEGVRVFDRTVHELREVIPEAKATYAVWGANHNFYNTEWQQSDSVGCRGAGNRALFDLLGTGSAAQRMTGLYAAMSMFLGHVGSNADAGLSTLFDPSVALPSSLASITTVDRGFSNSADAQDVYVLDDFGPAGRPGLMQSAHNVKVTSALVPDHDPTLPAIGLTWNPSRTTSPHDVYYEVNAMPSAMTGARGFKTLEFRISLQCKPITTEDLPCQAGDNRLNLRATTDLSIAAVQPGGTLGQSVALSRYADPHGPVGGAVQFEPSVMDARPILQTVRIPLADLGVAPDQRDGTASLRGVRFSFDRATTGAIYLAGLRLTDPEQPSLVETAVGEPGPTSMPAAAPGQADGQSDLQRTPTLPPGRVTSITLAPGELVERPGMMRAAAPSRVILTLRSPVNVMAADALMLLHVGGGTLRGGGYGGDGDMRTVVFAMERAAFDRLGDHAHITLINGASVQDYGALEKSSLK